MSETVLSETVFGPFWEVLNGVGVDGVGAIFPFFLRTFRFFTHFFVLFRFSSLFSYPVLPFLACLDFLGKF